MEMLRSHWTIAYKNNKHIRVCISALARESCGNVQEALCWWVYECACRCVGTYMNKRGWERLRRTYGGWWRPNNMHKATSNFDEMKRRAWNRIDLALHWKEELKKAVGRWSSRYDVHIKYLPCTGTDGLCLVSRPHGVIRLLYFTPPTWPPHVIRQSCRESVCNTRKRDQPHVTWWKEELYPSETRRSRFLDAHI